MRWTAETPTEAAWYWWRAKKGLPASVVWVVLPQQRRRHDCGLLAHFPACIQGGARSWVDEMGGEWAGPIKEPKE